MKSLLLVFAMFLSASVLAQDTKTKEITNQGKINIIAELSRGISLVERIHIDNVYKHGAWLNGIEKLVVYEMRSGQGTCEFKAEVHLFADFTNGNKRTDIVVLDNEYIPVSCEYLANDDAVLFRGQNSIGALDIEQSNNEKIVDSQLMDKINSVEVVENKVEVSNH